MVEEENTMREFAFASAADFADLKSILSDGGLHVYYNRVLPKGCNPEVSRIGFESSPEGYLLMIDKGIESKCSGSILDILLEKGEIKFLCMNEMMEFFHSLQPLFPNEEVSDSARKRDIEDAKEFGIKEKGSNDSDTAMHKEISIINRDKLRTIKERQCIKKVVWPEEIANPIKQKVYGQETAIDALADAIVINQIRRNDKLLVMAILGPPATGKSTVGRSLADVMSKLYGNQYGFIEIAASEYTQEHMVQKFLGAPPGYVGHGGKTVLEPIRKNKYHIILVNEIEKCHPNMLVAIMEAMDTGFLGMADNSPAIDLNHCILLFTSNIPIDMEEYSTASEFERLELCKDAFTKYCGRPEISRRIQDFMVFAPLSEDAEVDVIVKFAREALADMEAELVGIDEHLIVDFLKHKTKYGASELGHYVTRVIGRKILRSRQTDLVKGKKVTVYGTVDNIKFKIS